jgi:DNA-binding response OmpR family regulator
MATSVPNESSLPRRALVVDGDAQRREAAAQMLKAAGLEIAVAADGTEALTMFAREWYPIVMTDSDMPALDSFEFVARLRCVAVAPVYVIMLTASSDVRDHERGYCSGVDQYLTKSGYEAELVTKVLAGMTAVKRRQAARTGRANEPVTVDLENGAHTPRHLIGRLHAEIAHAARAGRALNVLSVALDATDSGRRRTSAPNSTALLTAVHSAIRPKLDWVARLPSPANTCRLAIVMPESEPVDVAAVQQAIHNAFVHHHGDATLQGIELSIGIAKLAASDSPPTALELLSQSERSRREKDSV